MKLSFMQHSQYQTVVSQFRTNSTPFCLPPSGGTSEGANSVLSGPFYARSHIPKQLEK
jgi:hypothetical protein